MFNIQHVTLCLLITYHWRGSTASPNVSVPAATVRIAAEVNGSPTDARLNIPVVKRSSNQAGFANELLRPALVERARAVVEVVPTLSEPPHEYANRNEEKYTNGIREPMGKLYVGKPPLDTEIFKHARVKRDENVLKEEEEEEEEVAEEKGNVARGIKSSIRAEDAAMVMELGLIGKANSSPLATSFQRRFDYERASASRVRHKRNEDGSSVVAERRKEYKKATNADELNNRETIVSSSFASGAPDFDVQRISDQDEVEVYGREGRDLPLGLGRIDGEMKNKVEEKQIQKKRKEDYDASRLSNRLSSSLKLTEQSSSEKSKSSMGGSSTASGEINKVLDSKRLHQQSRNTKPQTIAQHLRRNIKRQTLSFGDLMYGRTAGFYGMQNEDAPSKRIVRADDRDRRQFGGPQLRFIPSSNHRSHPVENRIYFGRNAQQTFPAKGSGGNNNDASSFYPNGETNPRAIEKFPRFDATQIESLKGVFDKFDVSRDGKRNELPNVRTILPKQIFVAPPRLVYDTKILPAPFSFPPYFQSPDSNVNKNNDNHKNDNVEKTVKPGFAISGVFDQKHQNELDNREVIPVSENAEPSLKDTLNFVTPLPPYRGDGGNGEVSIRVNQASEDFAELDEIYRVSGGDIGIGVKEKEASQRDEEDEVSRLNHESPIDVGTVHHPGFGGSSYDNSVSTFGSADESGSGNVDHSAVIEGNTDEYVNHEPPSRGSYTPAVRTRTQSVAKSNDETYDRGGYKWRGKYDNDNERYAANYSFGYRVSDYETQNNFGHQETRKEGITKGKYHVKLPDGRIQEVNYHVDGDGYHARVSYRLDRSE